MNHLPYEAAISERSAILIKADRKNRTTRMLNAILKKPCLELRMIKSENWEILIFWENRDYKSFSATL